MGSFKTDRVEEEAVRAWLQMDCRDLLVGLLADRKHLRIAKSSLILKKTPQLCGLKEWGFPPNLWRVRQMAKDLMKKRGILDLLGKN